MELDINKIIQQAFTAHKEGKLQEAEYLYQEVLKTQPNNVNVCNNLGTIYKSSGKLDEAEICYKKAIVFQPDYLDSYVNLGNLYQTLGKLEQAETSYKKLIELKYDYAEGHYGLGNTQQKLNKLEEAEISYKKAIEIKPDFFKAYNNLGLVLVELNKLTEAEIYYKNVAKFKPDYIDVHYNFAVLLFKLNKKDAANASLDKSLKLNPNWVPSLELKSQILFEKGKFELSLKNSDLCDTNFAKSLSLSSLYALGRIEEIYSRIDAQPETDNNNLFIAAFSSFITHKEKRDTAHKFCKNPLEFIYYSNLSSHLESSNSFINEMIKELDNVKIRWEPPENTTRKGFHTGNKINLFKKPLEKMSNLESIIIDELYTYKKKFKNENCTFIKSWPSKCFLSGWHVVLKKQGYQTAHIHPGGWLSGVIYLKVVPGLKKNEGAIEFSLNGNHYFDANSPKIIYQPNVGDIVLFPSSLHHRTIPFSTDNNRMIVSFDLVPI